MPSICSAEDQTQNFMYAKKVLCQLSIFIGKKHKAIKGVLLIQCKIRKHREREKMRVKGELYKSRYKLNYMQPWLDSPGIVKLDEMI